MTTPGDAGSGDDRSRREAGDNPADPERVVIRDKRRIDPTTGEPRPAETVAGSNGVGGNGAAGSGVAGSGVASSGAVGADGDPLLDVEDPFAGVGDLGEGSGTSVRENELEQALAERTADVQRLNADFANYRRRMDRDRELIAEVAVASAFAGLLPVLDDIDRARAHGDLSGAFKAVADGLDAVLAKAGLTTFGDEGDAFDPSIHEAVTHATSVDVDQPTTTVIMRRGYRMGDRLLRPAMVGVTDPE